MSLSPTVLNVVVDGGICHWVKVVEAMETGAKFLGALVQDLAAYFYANNRIVMSTEPERLQREFNIITDLFSQVVPRMNKRRPVIMD